MKVTLTRTGGIIPLKKQAEAEIDWTEDDVDALLTAASIDNSNPGQGRDSTCYRLQAGDKTAIIDFEKIPHQFHTTLNKLKESLQVVK